MATSEQPRPLNPGMVQRPVTPPSNTYRAPPEGDEKGKTFPFHFVNLVRTVIISLSSAAVAVAIDGGSPNAGPILLLVGLFAVLVWNVLLVAHWLVKRARKGRAGFKLPAFVCQVNSFVFRCGGRDDEEPPASQGEGDGNNGDHGPGGKLPKRPKRWIIDMALGVDILLLGLISMNDWRYYYNTREVLFPLAFTIAGLQFTVAILQRFWPFNSVIVHLYPEGQDSGDDYSYRILLPEEPVSRAAQSSHMSVVA